MSYLVLAGRAITYLPAAAAAAASDSPAVSPSLVYLDDFCCFLILCLIFGSFASAVSTYVFFSLFSFLFIYLHISASSFVSLAAPKLPSCPVSFVFLSALLAIVSSFLPYIFSLLLKMPLLFLRVLLCLPP